MSTPTTTAIKKYDTLEDMFNSEEFKGIWEGFQGIESSMRVYNKLYNEGNFIGAYVIPVDPSKNYLPYKLFILGTLVDKKHRGSKGLSKTNVFNQVTCGTMLTNSKPNYVLVNGMDVYKFDHTVTHLLREFPDAIVAETKAYL